MSKQTSPISNRLPLKKNINQITNHQPRMTRRLFLKTITFATTYTTALLTGCTTLKAKTKKPNIIFILADDLGFGDLGCYGQKQILTKNLDKMAAQGIRFTQHYAGSTVCAPSRCCLMTGLHTGHCWIRGNAGLPLRANELTVAKLLKKAGYTTALIGKWHLGDYGTTGVPNLQGFDYFFGYLNAIHAHNYYPEFLWRNNEKVPLRNIVVRPKSGYAKVHGGASTNCLDYAPDLFNQEALAFIQRNKDNPFFLYLAYTIPHANNEAHILNRHGMEVPDYGIYKHKNWPEPQKGHAAMITRLDNYIGQLLDKLKQLGLDDNTLVLFSSDNGSHKEGGADPKFFNSSGGLRGYKRDLYEGGIRVPLIARWPGKIKPGQVSNHISAFWDFLPTAAQLAQIKPPPNIDGISYLPELLGQHQKQKKHQFLYWEFHEQGKKQAVRMGNWKAVRLNVAKNPNAPLELYNLKTDPAEKHNVADKHPDIVAKIENYLKTARTASPRWPLSKQG